MTSCTNDNCDATKQLESLQAKFDAWQSKAKLAMDKQRAQFKDVDGELKDTQKQLAAALSPSSSSSQSNTTSYSTIFQLQIEESDRRGRILEAALFSRLEVVAAFLGSAVRTTTTAAAAAASSSPSSATASSSTSSSSDKQARSRSERALLQANAANVELSEKATELQDRLRGAHAEHSKTRERLEVKDNTIRALEAQLVEAAFAVQQASGRAERAEEDSRKAAAAAAAGGGVKDSRKNGGDASSSSWLPDLASAAAAGTGTGSGSSSAASRQLSQQIINELRDEVEASQSTIQDLRLQVDHLNLVAQRERAARQQQQQQQQQQQLQSSTSANGGASMMMSDAERDELIADADELRKLNNDLRAKVSTLEMRCSGEEASSSTIAALRQQLSAKAQQVFELQESLAAASSSPASRSAPTPADEAATMHGGGSGAPAASAATAAISSSQQPPSQASASADASSYDPHLAHLRSTILQLLVCDRDDVKAHLIPVVAALLQLPQCDVRAVYSAHPEWMPQQ